MTDFLQGLLVSNEIGATDGGKVYDRWLRLQVAPGCVLSVFDPACLSTDLAPGQVCTFAVLLGLLEGVRPSANTDLTLIRQRHIVRIDEQVKTATPEEIVTRSTLMRGKVHSTRWQTAQQVYERATPAFPAQSYLLLQTAFGAVLVSPAELPAEACQEGMTLEWETARLDLLAIISTHDTPSPERPEPTILRDPSEALIDRFAGKPLEDILKSGSETWNSWRRAVMLSAPNLIQADLHQQDLQWANLTMARLDGANLIQANLTAAHLQRARLGSAKLSGAILREAQLQHAQLDSALLLDADLQQASLEEAELFQAKLSGASLHSADLREANLTEADLREVDLREANLQGAILDGANLQGAQYTSEQLKQAASLEHVMLSS